MVNSCPGIRRIIGMVEVFWANLNLRRVLQIRLRYIWTNVIIIIIIIIAPVKVPVNSSVTVCVLSSTSSYNLFKAFEIDTQDKLQKIIEIPFYEPEMVQLGWI